MAENTFNPREAKDRIPSFNGKDSNYFKFIQQA
jgi:hypothetical protein